MHISNLLLALAISMSETGAPPKGLYQLSPFPIGVAVNIDELGYDSVYRNVITAQFNSITPENNLKPSLIHPSENKYNWQEADRLADYCTLHGKRLHGHTLIWDQQLPDWILHYKGNTSDWDRLLKQHITTIVAHFKGKVGAWDVVNEAFDSNGLLKNSIWKKNLGSDYVARAFRYAHEADPGALLFYNDADLESNEKKTTGVLSFLNSLRSKGIPIDGIGMQMHINVDNFSILQFSRCAQTIASNGYKVHLSEVDISLNPQGKDIQPTTELFDRQAILLGEITRCYSYIPLSCQYGITFWGVSDKDSWIRHIYKRKDYPLLYDDHFLPKPAYSIMASTLLKIRLKNE